MAKKRALYILAASIMIVSMLYAAFTIRESYLKNNVKENHVLSIIANPLHYTDSTMVAAMHLSDESGNPLKGELEITMFAQDDEEIQKGYFETDYLGNSTIKMPLNNLAGRIRLGITARSEIGENDFVYNLNVSAAEREDIIIHFDKGMYKPGDNVLFRLLAVSKLNSRPVRQNYRLSIFDGNDNRVYSENASTSEFGIVSGSFKLANEVNSGTYRLVVEGDDLEVQQAFEVKPYLLPKFEVALHTDAEEYLLGETINIAGSAKYFFGEPVNQGTVNVLINNELRLENAPLDENGEFIFNYVAGEATAYNIRAEVIDNSNYLAVAEKTVRAVMDVFEINLFPEHGQLIRNIPNDMYIFTKKADGSPVKAYIQVSGPGFSRQVATDESGIGKFILEDVSPYGNIITVMAQDMEGNTVRAEFDFGYGEVRDIAIRTDKPRYNIGETIRVSVLGKTSFGLNHVYAYKNDRLLHAVSSELDNIELYLADVYGLIDIYAVKADGGLYAHKTVFVDPGEHMRLQLINDKPEYKPGEFVNLSIGVSNDSGNPLEAALLVNMVDEAVLNLAANDLSIDNIKLALADIRFSDELDAATLYISLISAASEQTLMGLLLRQEEAGPNHRINQLSIPPIERDNKYIAVLLILLLCVLTIIFLFFRFPRIMKRLTLFLLICLGLLIVAIVPFFFLAFIIGFFFALALFVIVYVIALVLIAVAFFKKSSLPAQNEAAKLEEGPKESISVWTVVAAILIFIVVAFFLSSCSSPMMNMQAPEFFDSFPGFNSPAQSPPVFAPITPAPPTTPAPTPIPELVVTPDQATMPALAEEAEAPSFATEQEAQTARVRSLFLETMLFLPEVIARNGQANLDFMLADNITTWNIQVVGNTKEGLIGHTSGSIRAFQPFFVDFELPKNSIRYDEISIPLTVFNYTEAEQTVVLTIAEMDWFTLNTSPLQTMVIPSNQSKMVYIPISIKRFGNFVFRVQADAPGYADAVEKGLRINPEGFRVERVVSSGSIENDLSQHILFMQNDIPDTRRVHVRLHPSSMSQLVEGMENIFRMPMGCFEQTSSSLYPNILALRYMQANNIINDDLSKTALEYISSGYQRLLTFEVTSDKGGFSLFGDAPAETVLTAYGLMQLQDLSSVYDVDEAVLDRMKEYLFRLQNSDGAFNIKGYHTAGVSNQDSLALNAYITWALSEAYPEDSRLDSSVGYLKNCFAANLVDDNYTLALIANVLINVDDPMSRDVVEKLHSNTTVAAEATYITSSLRDYYGAYGTAQTLQATALTSIAFTKVEAYAKTNKSLIDFVIEQKDAYGTWSSTQGTILCLKALTLYSEQSPLEDGEVTVSIGDTHLTIDIQKENTLDFYQVTFEGLPNENIVNIRFPNLGKMVYDIVQEYYAPYNALDMEGDFEIISEMKTKLAVNEWVSQRIKIINRSGHLVSNGLAVISIPQGFRVEESTLASLAFSGVIEKYETRYDAVNLYLRDIEPGQIIDVEIGMRPGYPVNITGGHIRVYDYYNPILEGVMAPFGITVR